MAETVRPQGRRIIPFGLFRGLAAFALLTAGLLIASPVFAATTITPTSASPVSAAHTIAATTVCGNGIGNGGGQGLICEVTIVNTVTPTGGTATVTVRECLGSAGAPTDGAGTGGFLCNTQTTTVAQPVTRVEQCNAAVSGGGGKLLCWIVITNNFTGVSPGSTAVTVNQCVGSGGAGGTMVCNPVEATTSAAITQCNGTGTGDGTTLACTATGQMAAALPITILQCQGSANGGGSAVVCSASMTNNAVAAPSPSPSGTASPTGTTGATPPTNSTVSQGSSSSSIPPMAVLLIGLGLGLGALGLMTYEWRRRSIRS
jgi:hypothetical protein